MTTVRSNQDLLSLYQNGLGAEEKWMVQTQQQVATQPPLSGDVVDAKNQLQSTMVCTVIIHSHSEHGSYSDTLRIHSHGDHGLYSETVKKTPTKIPGR